MVNLPGTSFTGRGVSSAFLTYVISPELSRIPCNIQNNPTELIIHLKIKRFDLDSDSPGTSSTGEVYLVHF